MQKIITIEELFSKIVPNIGFSEEQVIGFLKNSVEEEKEKVRLKRHDIDFVMNLSGGVKIKVPLSQVKQYLKDNVFKNEEQQSELDKFLTGKSKVMKPEPPPPPPKKEEIVAAETALPAEPIKTGTKKK